MNITTVDSFEGVNKNELERTFKEHVQGTSKYDMASLAGHKYTIADITRSWNVFNIFIQDVETGHNFYSDEVFATLEIGDGMQLRLSSPFHEDVVYMQLTEEDLNGDYESDILSQTVKFINELIW